MRVLYVEAPVGFGGSLTGLLQLIHALPSRIEPILVTSFDPAPYIDLPAGLVHRRVQVPDRTPSDGRWLRGAIRYYRQAVRPWRDAVQQLICEFQPDLIHANNCVTVNLGVGLAARAQSVPAISHQKGCEYPGRLTRLTVKRSGFTHHIATSGAIARHLIALGLPADRCTTIYEPVVGPTNCPDRDARRRDVPVAAMHSIIGRWKGQHIVLQAAAEVLRRGRCDFRLEVAGAPPGAETDYLDELRSMVSSLRLQDKVCFVGHQKDVYGFLAGADFAVHASLQPEPFGRVVAEAMLAGLPSIVTTEGGPAEYVAHGVTGLHVPCGDASAMADAMAQLVASPELRMRMGAAARDYAVAEFDPGRLTQQVVDVYDRLLRGQRPAAAGESLVKGR